MSKSPDAFRTISEVADWLGIQAHVLRFWESKFSQVKPVKRAGGRRYYRPNDMLLLGGIKRLLHEDGLTIKGVQKILREEGVGHVVSMSQPLDDADDVEAIVEESPFIEAEPEQDAQSGVVLNFDGSQNAPEAEEVGAPGPQEASAPEPVDEPVDPPQPQHAEPEGEPEAPGPVEVEAREAAEVTPPAAPEPAPADEAPRHEAADEAPAPESEAAPDPQDAPAAPAAATLPAFLRRPMAPQPEDATDNPPADPEPPAPAPAPVAALRPRVIDMPTITPPHEMDVAPATLSAVYRTRKLTTAQARQMAPLLDRLTILRDSMAARRRPTTQPGAID